MSHLHLALLGAPEIRHAERILKFRSRKVLALLTYLAVEGGKHTRVKITALFWPESDEAQGRTALRRTLADLRDALDDPAGPSHLLVERDSLGFDFTSDFELDLRILETAWMATRGAPTLPSGGVVSGETYRHLFTQLQPAAKLSRGSFLEGFSLNDAPDFDDWLRLQREVWHRRMSMVFDRLSQLQSDGGETQSAIDTVTRWVAQDLLNEAAHQRLMQLYFTSGERNAALRAYAYCKAVLAEQLNTGPAPETEALAERIRARTHPAPAASRATTKAPSTASPSSFAEGPLVGRAHEYSKLIEPYHTILRGPAQIVTLQGESGIGKTRLASEFLHWAAAWGTDVLQGRAFETGGRLPYQPLVEALRSRLEREHAPDDLLSDPWLAELSRLLPELRDRYPDLPPPTGDETAARIRLFEAVARLGHALAERGPVVLFLDDVQWIDAASLDVLHYIARRWVESNTAILLLLSLRSEGMSTTQTLTRWLAEVEHDLPTTHLILGPLQFEDMVQLLSALGNGEPTARKVEEFGQWLFAETGGQPFYVMETLKALLARGMLTLSPQTDGRLVIDLEAIGDGPWTGTSTTPSGKTRKSSFLPRGVREVIRSRLEPLTPSAFTLVAAGAVLGHGFTFEHLCHVAGLGENDALPALDEAVMIHLLQEGSEGEYGTSAGIYSFTHDKIRDVVYGETGEARRRTFHRRALEALQAVAAPPAELAHHALAAGLAESAYHLCVSAGDDALRLFAVRDALAHYEQARQVLASQQELHAALPLSHVQHLYVQLGRAYELNNEWEHAHALYQDMLEMAQRSNASIMECTALNRLGTLVMLERYDLGHAALFLHQALQVAEGTSDPVSLAETEWNLAQLSFYQFDTSQAIAHGERALRFARELGQQELIARSLDVTAKAKKDAGYWHEAMVLAEEACVIYRELGNRAMEADCLCTLAGVRINSGYPQDGIHLAQMAWAISEEIENDWGKAFSGYHLAAGFLEIGAYDEALSYAQQSVTIARTNKVSLLQGFCLVILGTVYRARLSLDDARKIHLEARTVYEGMHSQLLAESASSELCADYAMAGAWAEAHTCALEALASRNYYIHLSSRLASWYQTEALVRAGQTERAIEDVRYFGTLIGESRRYRIPYLRALAVLALHTNEIEKAIESLQEAARLAEEIGLPGEQWSIQMALGDVYRKQGDESQTDRAFARAASLVRSLARSIGDEQQRAKFLSAELTRYVVEQATALQ